MTAILDRPLAVRETPQAGDPDTASVQRGRVGRFVRGSAADPGWVRPALFGLLGLTALLYLWDLSASGYANSFYASAAQAGSVNWKAWFFGSLDSGNAITVDKPPASLWVMGLSGRIFGFSSWSLLAPQALEGVAAVGLLFATVRRSTGPVAGLVAAATLALTPAAVLMFRFDNPDAMLVLVLVAAAYTVVRALENASTRWLLGAGALIGLGFLTKMGQALLVVPAFGLAYLVAAPTGLWRRVAQLMGSLVAMYAVAGAYVAAVALTPAADRPFIAGSGDNTILGLAFGYNGLGRLFGGSGNGGGGGGTNSSFGGATGWLRLFGGEFAYEISWLLPAALVSLVLGLWMTRRAPRTDKTRASLILWGGWLLVTGYTFSFMEGTIHPYYTIALAPAVAALTAIAGRLVWQARDTWTARIGGAAMVAVTADWCWVLLGRLGIWSGLRTAELIGGGLLTAAILLRPAGSSLTLRRLAVGITAATVLVTGITAGAYGVATAGVAHTGSIPTAGANASGGGMGGGGGGGGGGGDEGTTTNTALVTLLKATTTRWAAAAQSSGSAAPYQLASGKAVMAIGGFNGSDDAPTLAQFEAYVAKGEIGYYVSGGQGGAGGGTGSIATWVAAHYTATTVGGTTVYDLTVAAK